MRHSRLWEYGLLLHTIVLTANGATVCSHAYLYDAMQLRTQATLENASMWKYAYNDRNQKGSNHSFTQDRIETATNSRANAPCWIWRRKQLLGVPGLATKVPVSRQHARTGRAELGLRSASGIRASGRPS